MPQSLTHDNLAHSRHFSSICPIYDALPRLIKNMHRALGRKKLRRISRELWWGGGILSTRHKLSFPNFPSSSGSAAAATLPENALVELFLVTDRVWKLEVVDPVWNWVSSPRLSHQGNKPFLTAIYRFWNQRKTRRKFHRCANLCSNSGHKFPSNAS